MFPWSIWSNWQNLYDDVITGAMASQITSLTIVYSAVYSGAENIKAPRHWPLASNAENVSIWWRHHDDGTATSDTQPWKQMSTMGQVDTFHSVIIIRCIRNIYFWSPKLEWDNWSYSAEVGINLGKLSQYHGFWWLYFLCRRVISSCSIEHVK